MENLICVKPKFIDIISKINLNSKRKSKKSVNVILKLIKLNIELQALVQLLKEKSSIILEDVADSTNQDIQHVDWIDQRGVQHKLN